MLFQDVDVVLFRVHLGEGKVGEGRRRAPDYVVVVGEHGEEDAEEEACCWGWVSGVGEGGEREDVRPTIRNVAKGAVAGIVGIDMWNSDGGLVDSGRGCCGSSELTKAGGAADSG